MRIISLLTALALLSSSHFAHYDFKEVNSSTTPGFTIDWTSRQKGLECRSRCVPKAKYVAGFCSVIASFSSAALCAIFLIQDPLVCGLLEGSTSGLAAFCGAGFLEGYCDRCEKVYSLSDVFSLSVQSYRETVDVLGPLDNILLSLEQIKVEYQDSTLKLISRLETSISQVST